MLQFLSCNCYQLTGRLVRDVPRPWRLQAVFLRFVGNCCSHLSWTSAGQVKHTTAVLTTGHTGSLLSGCLHTAGTGATAAAGQIGSAYASLRLLLLGIAAASAGS
jgi:hypothetical protein